jgi:hypothetical protein
MTWLTVMEYLCHKWPRVTRTPLKPGGELRCSVRVSSSCSTSDTCRVNLVTNPVISHEWGKDREVFTTSGCLVLFDIRILITPLVSSNSSYPRLERGSCCPIFSFVCSVMNNIAYNCYKQRFTKHTCKTKDRVTRTPLKPGGELRCSVRVSSSCSTSDTCRVNLVTNPVYVRHHDLFDRYGISVSQMTTDMIHMS